MPQFFIHRPIFAWVVAILITFVGLLSIPSMPISQYPEVAPPTIEIRAFYPGASPEEVSRSVTSIIEDELNGAKGMIYYESTSDTNGNALIKVTFEPGTDPEMAQIETQNKVSNVTAALPSAVIQQGLRFAKANSNFLLLGSVTSDDGSYSSADLADYIARNVKNSISRIQGVGTFQLFGAQRAMRVWVDPNKLTSFGMSMSDVNNALREQHMLVSAGVLGSPPTPEDQTISAIVRSNGELTTVKDFEEVVLRSDLSGAIVRLKDVAKVEIGQDSYNFQGRLNAKPTASFAVSLAPNANALETAGLVKAELESLKRYFPASVDYVIPYDTSPYVEKSIMKVFYTLIEAIGLVFVVMFLFFQNFRYTLIPSIVVPVALLGTVACMLFFGYSINTMTMFAMVLSIGILVDDAIVVVENVERIMATEGLPPLEATIKAMPQVSGAIVGITLVLITVFFPLLFMSGSSGIIYRQFAVAMAVSIFFSGFLALTFTPALCATILKPIPKGHNLEKKGFFGWFNRSFDKLTASYSRSVAALIKRGIRMMLLYLALVGGAIYLFGQLPSSFMPEEDQAVTFTLVELPAGSTAERTVKVLEKVENFYLNQEETASIIAVQGFSFNGSGLNAGIAFASLKSFAERTKPENSSAALAGRATGALLFGVPDATIFSITPPAIPALGNSSGFDLRLQDRGNLGQEALRNAAQQLLHSARTSGVIVEPRIAGLGPGPQLELEVDREKIAALGVSMAEVRSVMSTAVGTSFIGKFPNMGRMQNVWVQADEQGRMSVDDILALKVRNNTGGLVDLGSVLNVDWGNGPMQVTRYNSYDALTIQGAAAPGYANGEAMAKLVEIIENELPNGIGYEWSGLSYQEIQAGNQAPILMGLAMIVVFLVLAALYESWSIPLAAILIVPLGMLGTIGLTTILGMSNDIYFQVGMITVIGLSAKNAILIVEFAKDAYATGTSLIESAVEAAHLRFRPILMTSFAFIMGVVPLAMATGEGAAGQQAIGLAVLGGMLAATPFSVFFVPVFFVVVLRFFKAKPRLLGTQQELHAEEVELQSTKQAIYADMPDFDVTDNRPEGK